MCMGGAPSTPAPPPLPPPPAPPPTPAEPAVVAARARNRAAADLAQARPILSSPQGDLSPAGTTKKTALGL